MVTNLALKDEDCNDIATQIEIVLIIFSQNKKKHDELVQYRKFHEPIVVYFLSMLLHMA